MPSRIARERAARRHRAVRLFARARRIGGPRRSLSEAARSRTPQRSGRDPSCPSSRRCGRRLDHRTVGAPLDGNQAHAAVHSVSVPPATPPGLLTTRVLNPRLYGPLRLPNLDRDLIGQGAGPSPGRAAAFCYDGMNPQVNGLNNEERARANDMRRSGNACPQRLINL